MITYGRIFESIKEFRFDIIISIYKVIQEKLIIFCLI